MLVRFRPGAAWPVLVAAVRDEFLDRPWDPPAAHWPQHPSTVGGRDRTAGGTWLAVDTAPTRRALAAVLNGKRLPLLASGATRPSRGALPLAALTGTVPANLDGYDGFHLLSATAEQATVVTWDGEVQTTHNLAPGDHIIVNIGVDETADPLVPHFAPLFAALPEPPLSTPGTDLSTMDTKAAWGPWVEFLLGDGLPVDHPAALLLRQEISGTEPGTEALAGRVYGSGSAALVALGPRGVRYDFTPTPLTPQWTAVVP